MGRLIVLEGIDGSGKSTQLELLCKRLTRKGRDFRRVSFPRYSEPSSALVRMYLAGEFGDNPGDVNAYAASAFYAVDRFASYRTDWGEYLSGGGLVVTDRYTTSNAIHQGAKLPEDEREGYFSWLYDFEFRLLGLPAPDMVLYMDIPADKAMERVRLREGFADIHERDAGYIARCAGCGAQAARYYGWRPVDASRSEGDVHSEVYKLVTCEE